LKIGASTPYDFSKRNLTAYGGLLPVAAMLEKLGFEQLVEETLTIGRLTRAMPVYRFVLAMVLTLYVGLSGARADVDRDSQNTALAAAVHILAVSGFAASERGRADSPGSARHGCRLGKKVLRRRVWEACLERWEAKRRKPPLRQMGMDGLYRGKRDKFLSVVCNLETGEPLWFGKAKIRGGSLMKFEP
jgi:hypothetical protein